MSFKSCLSLHANLGADNNNCLFLLFEFVDTLKKLISPLFSNQFKYSISHRMSGNAAGKPRNASRTILAARKHET